MPLLQDLLTWIEKETQGRFICANFMGAKEKQQHWLSDYLSYGKGMPSLFSNRLFYGNRHWRNMEQLGETEQFFRLDFENLQSHHNSPLQQQELDLITKWAIQENACGVLPTKNGVHVFFLTDKPILPDLFKEHILQKVSSCQSSLQLDIKASFAKNNWSKTHKKILNYSSYNRLYTIAIKSILQLPKNKQLTKGGMSTFSGISGKLSSELEKHEEFKSILKNYVGGQALSDIPMLYHKPEILAKRFESDKNYDWVNDARSNRPSLGTRIGFLGAFGHARGIQRDFSFWGHIRHSLADLARSNYTVDAALAIFTTDSKYEEAFSVLLDKFPKELKKIFEENLLALRKKYSTVGLYEVSPEVFKQVKNFCARKKWLDINDLHAHLIAANQQMNEHHTSRGVSASHLRRILGYLSRADIIKKDGNRYKINKKFNNSVLKSLVESARKQPKPIEINKDEENEVKADVVKTPDTITTIQQAAPTVFVGSPQVYGVRRFKSHGYPPPSGENRRNAKPDGVLDVLIT
jgi:hypothetical protein